MIERLRELDKVIFTLMGEGERADSIIRILESDHNARHRFTNGTNELRMAGVVATSTVGGDALLQAWQRASRRRIEKLEGWA